MRRALPLLALALAGCTASPQGHELAALSFGYAIPQTSPGMLTEAFDRYCADDRVTAATAARLTADDYVEVPRGGTTIRSFVVRDMRPMVMVSDRGCAVAARSRTGQSTRSAAYVAERFPGAAEVAPDRMGQGVERAWLLPDGSVVARVRRGLPGRSTVMLQISRGRVVS
jgi:hypothetical protein